MSISLEHNLDFLAGSLSWTKDVLSKSKLVLDETLNSVFDITINDFPILNKRSISDYKTRKAVYLVYNDGFKKKTQSLIIIDFYGLGKHYVFYDSNKEEAILFSTLLDEESTGYIMELCNTILEDIIENKNDMSIMPNNYSL